MPFLPPLLLILAFHPILFHTIVTGGHMLFSVEELFKKSRAELFDRGVANDTYVRVHHVDTLVLFC